MPEVALELQPLCGKRSGITFYTLQLARNVRNTDRLHFHGELFNFLNRNDNRAALEGVTLPIETCRLFPYGVYRRIWNTVPIRHDRLFPKADVRVFFDYIVPPRVDGIVIDTVHDLTVFRHPETMEDKNRRRLKEGLRRSIERSRFLIAVSEFTKREICTLLSVPEERVFVVPNAASVSDAVTDFPALAKRIGLQGSYLLYTGTIEPRKNLVRLIEAYTLLRRRGSADVSLVLCGGKGWQSEPIYEAAAKSPFAGDIIFTGYVSDAEKNTLFQNAAGFVFPSLYEGFGVPPLEAMHFGVPVLTSTAASLPEVCDSAALYVPPEDRGAIAEGMEKLLSDTALRETLTDAGRKRAAEYSWSASARSLERVCEKALEGS